MKYLTRLLVPSSLIFVAAVAIVGITFAWINIYSPLLPGFEDGQYRFAELEGELDTEVLEVYSGGITPGGIYYHAAVITNKSKTANAHLRAYVLWNCEEADGTLVPIDKKLITVKLLEGEYPNNQGSEWEWTLDNDKKDGSWIRKSKSGVDNILPYVTEAAIEHQAMVTLKFEVDKDIPRHSEDLNLKANLVVEFEGELSWKL